MNSTETTDNGVDRLHPHLRSSLQAVGKWLAAGPVSLVLAAALATLFGVSEVLGHAQMAPYVSAGFGHPWWTIFSSMFWTTDALHVLVDVTALLSVGVMTEKLMGSLRYLSIGLVSYWLATLSALGSARLIAVAAPTWGDLLHSQDIAGTGVFLVGVVMAVSVRVPVQWRRRIQVTVGSLLLVLFGFAGTLDALAASASALIGWGIGFALWAKLRDERTLPGRRLEGRVLVALVVAGVVVGVLVSLSSPGSIGALSSLRYDFVSHELSAQNVAALCSLDGLEGQCAHYTYLLKSAGWGSKILVLMPLLMQLALAWGLRGGRRAAMWGTIALQGTTALVAIFHLVRLRTLVKSWSQASTLLGFTESGAPTARFIIPIVVPLILVWLVAGSSRLFTVRARPGTYRRFWKVLLGATGGTMAVAVVLGIIFRGTLFAFEAAGVIAVDFLIRLLPSSMLSIVSPGAVLENHAMMIILEWAPIVPWLVGVLGVLWSFSRKVLPSTIGRAEYVRILKVTGAGSLGWMGTWKGNHYWRSKEFEAAIAYRASGGVALTVSDPAARPEDLMGALKEFTDFCVEQDLTPAFYSVHGSTTCVTDKWDWLRLQVAEETLLPLADLEFKGKKFQGVRTALNRAEKEGIKSEWTTWGECSENYRAQIEAISNQWVGDKPLPEMGFTLGSLEELDDPEVALLLAVDGRGQVHGVTSWMPIYRDSQITGWTLDFMRRLEGGFRPVMEYLIAEAALRAKNEGYELLSLSGAPLAKAEGDASAQGSSARYLDVVLEMLGAALEPAYGFRSLLAFKNKFRPTHAPMYLTVPDVTALPAVGLAIGHAYLPTLSFMDATHVLDSFRKKQEAVSK